MANPHESDLKIALYALKQHQLFLNKEFTVNEAEKEAALHLDAATAIDSLYEALSLLYPDFEHEEIMEKIIELDVETQVVHILLHKAA